MSWFTKVHISHFPRHFAGIANCLLAVLMGHGLVLCKARCGFGSRVPYFKEELNA
jgi:hypothetical protein